MASSFQLSINNFVAQLSFNRADKANSLDETSWEEMSRHFEAMSANPDVRVIVLSGEGKHFCAGMDLETLMAQNAMSESCEAKKRLKLRTFITKIQNCISSIEHCKKPVIAAVHGGCIGGGVSIATACDMRYASHDAYFSIREVDLGIVVDIGALQRLPKLLGQGLVAELLYTGRKVDGQEAEDIGLVNKAFKSKEDMLQSANKMAELIAAKSPLVISGIKEHLLYQRDHSIQESLSNVANYNAGMLLSNDLVEAFSAYVGKRPAKFE